jgi:D-alanyl-D-alanine carboxypeptidase
MLVAGCAVPRDPILPVDAATPSPTLTRTATPTPTPTPTPTFDRAARSVDDPASLWVVSNKRRPLQPIEYAPADIVRVQVPYTNEPFLRAEAAAAVEALFAAAEAEAGLRLQSLSTYRSYSTQVRVYNDIVANRGQDYANRRSARPGHSEHQTGLAIDIGSIPASCAFDPCFGTTPHGEWLAANAWRFGFLLRYPEGLTPITGFDYEPWHFRYVGPELAAELHETGIRTLEEFFDLPPAPDYAG